MKSIFCIFCIMVLLFCGLSASTRGTTAPAAEKVFIISEELVCVGNEQVTITTYSDGSFGVGWSDGSYQYYSRGGSGAPPDVNMGDPTESSTTEIADDDSGFKVTVTTKRRPNERGKDYVQRHVDQCHWWQEYLGLPLEPPVD